MSGFHLATVQIRFHAALVVAVLVGLAASAAQAAPHPDARIDGYVWREA